LLLDKTSDDTKSAFADGEKECAMAENRTKLAAVIADKMGAHAFLFGFEVAL
jgi:hypothetical protein